MLIEIHVHVQKYESDWVKQITGSQPPSADSWDPNRLLLIAGTATAIQK